MIDRAISSLVWARATFTKSSRSLAADLVISEKLKATRRRRRRSAPLRAAREAHDFARGRAGAILGGTADGSGFRRSDSLLPRAKICRSLSSVAVRICSCAMAGSAGVVVHPSGGDFERIEVDGNEITAGVGAKLKEIAYAGKSGRIGWPGMDGRNSGRGGRRLAHERRRDGGADFR